MQSRSLEIRCYNDHIAQKIDRQLGNAAADVSVKFQSDWNCLNPNLVASGTRSCDKTPVRLVNKGAGIAGAYTSVGLMLLLLVVFMLGLLQIVLVLMMLLWYNICQVTVRAHCYWNIERHHSTKNPNFTVCEHGPVYLSLIAKPCRSWRAGPRLNIKTVLSTYGDFHVKDKTAVRTSYL